MFFHNYVEELSRGKRSLEPGAQRGVRSGE